MKLLIMIATIACCLSANAQSVQELLHAGELALDPIPTDVSKITYNVSINPGKPWIVFVHGLGGRKESWDQIMFELARDFQVLAFDQRGHGKNTTKSQNYSSSTMARDMRTLMDHLKIEKAHVVGHSMGGRTVMRFGSMYPDSTLSVVVEDMHALGRKTRLDDVAAIEAYYKSAIKPVYASAEEFFNAFRGFYYWESKKDILKFGYIDKVTKEFVVTRNLSRDFSTLYYHNQGLQEDLTKALASIKAPITFFAAGKEPVLFGKGIEHIQKTNPKANIVLFEKADHSIHLSARRSFISTLTEVIDRSSVAAKSAKCSALF